MTNTTPEENGWKACPAGTLVDYARRAKTARRNRTVLRLAGEIGAAVILFLLVVWLAPWGDRKREFDYGGISCHDVQSEMKQYMMGGLAPEVREKVRLHLAQCPRCQELMKKMQGANATAVRSGRYWSVSAHVDFHEFTGESGIVWEQPERSEIKDRALQVFVSDLPWRPISK